MTFSPNSATALFCEDIREESSGQLTLVGVFPDGILVRGFPGAFPKLCVLTRINISPEDPPSSIKTRLVHPDGTAEGENAVDREIIEAACREAKELGMPTAGIHARIISTNFGIRMPGLIRAMVQIDDQDYEAGFLAINAATTS